MNNKGVGTREEKEGGQSGIDSPRGGGRELLRALSASHVKSG